MCHRSMAVIAATFASSLPWWERWWCPSLTPTVGKERFEPSLAHMNDTTREWGTRFMERNGGAVPTMGHIAAYASVTHYLKAVEAAGTDDAEAVNAKMKELLGKALGVLTPEQIWVNPDCGLKTRKWEEVKPSIENMVEAAKALR